MHEETRQQVINNIPKGTYFLYMHVLCTCIMCMYCVHVSCTCISVSQTSCAYCSSTVKGEIENAMTIVEDKNNFMLRIAEKACASLDVVLEKTRATMKKQEEILEVQINVTKLQIWEGMKLVGGIFILFTHILFFRT